MVALIFKFALLITEIQESTKLRLRHALKVLDAL